MIDFVSDEFGHVKLSRKMFDPRVGDALWFEERVFTKFEAWVDLIQLAQWAPRKMITTKFGTITLERGEFVLSIRQMAKRWSWSIQSVRTFVKSTEFSTRIATQRETQAGTVYLIVNYDKYQSTPDRSNTAKGARANKPATHLQHTSNTRTSSKAVKQELPTTLSDSTTESADQLGLDVPVPSDVQVVLDHYLLTHPRRRIGPKDRKAVAKALTLGYAASELIEAIDGNAKDTWHAEKHKHELPYVLRDTGKIDDFRERASSANGAVAVDPETGLPNDIGMAVIAGGRR